MTQFCTECGAVIEPGVKFCVNCGAKAEAAEPVLTVAEQAPAPEAHQEAPAQPSQPDQPSQPPQPKPAPAKTPEVVKSIGFFWSLWHLFLLNIPVLGLILSLVWGLRTRPKNRSSLARAMIFINIIWIAVIVMLGISIYPLLHQLSQVAGYSIQIFGVSLRF